MSKNFLKKTIALMMAATLIAPSIPATALNVNAEAAATPAYENDISDYTTEIAKLSFDSVEDGFSGAGAAAISGTNTDLSELLYIEEGEDGVLHLESANSEFICISKEDGSSLLTGVDEMLVSFDVNMANTNATKWIFYMAPNKEAQKSMNEQYLGIFGKGSGVTVERFYNTGSRPASNTGGVVADGTWHHVDIVYEEYNTILYVDGIKVNEVASAFVISDMLGEESIIQIGKANWNAGEYTDMYLDDFSVRVKSADGGTDAAETDKSALKQAVEKAASLKEEEYISASWAAFAENIVKAQEVLDNVDATQIQVNAALASLDVLVKKDDTDYAGMKLRASYDMSVSDGKLIDQTGNGFDASIVSETVDYAFVGELDHVWNLSGDDYANIPEGIITGETFAVEAVFREPAAANSWLWCLGTKMGSSPNVTNYVFISPRFAMHNDVIRAGAKGTGTEYIFANAGKVTGDTYATARIEFDHGTMRLLINGIEVSSMETGLSIQDILTAGSTDGVCGYIGRSTYKEDPLFTGTITQLDIYVENDLKLELRNEVAAAKQLREFKYTPETWTEFSNVLSAAELVLNDENAKQTDIEEACLALQLAVEKLVLKERPEVLADFNFDTESADGKTFDGGYAQASGTYTLEKHGDGQALKLDGKGQFLELTAKEGGSLLTDLSELTVSFLMKPETSATNWAFFAAPNANQQVSNSEKYIGIFDSNGTVSAERFNSNNEARPEKPSLSMGYGAWYHVTVVFTESETILYVNGEEAARKTSTVDIYDLLGENSVAYIGKSTWLETGEYYTGLIDDYKIYSKALTAEEVEAAAYDFVSTFPMIKSAVVGTIPTSEEADNNRGTDYHTAIRTFVDDENKVLTPYVRNSADADVTKLPVAFTLHGDADITVNGKSFVNGGEMDLSKDVEVVLKNTLGREETWTIKAARIGNNPVLPGQYADPDIDYFDGKFWIFPTTDGYYGFNGSVFHAWSSEDMVNWTDEGIIMDLANDNPGVNENGVQIAASTWAVSSAWAPSIEEKDGKYYFYYCGRGANGQNAIGVAVADDPAGPYTDLGEPLLTVDKVRSAGLSIGLCIDPSIFTEEHGTSYILFGNGRGVIAELGEDMMSIVDGTMAQINGLKDFMESVVVMKVDGKYHWTWSCSGTQDPNYRVNYGVTDSLYEDVQFVKTLLFKNAEQDLLGTGHQSLLHIKDAYGEDRYFIAYHRFYTPLNLYTAESGLGYHRETCIDEITFDENGYMVAKPTLEGVSEVSVTVNKTALKAEVESVIQEIMPPGSDSSEYTKESWEVFIKALTDAERVLADEEVTQDVVDEAVAALAEAKAGLKEAPVVVDKGENIAPKAAASGSYASSWMTLQFAGINDGIDTIPAGANGNDYAWATWGNTTGSEYIQYNWETVVEITGADLYIWDDNPNDLYTGVDTPSKLVYEYLPDNSNEWVELAVVTEGIAGGSAGELNEVTFEEPVKAAALRVTLVKNLQEGVTEAQEGVGATEWKVYGTDTGVAVTVPVDKSALEVAVNAEKAAALVKDDYTEETWKAYADTLAKAEALLEHAEATQSEVDAAVIALADAKADLEKKPVVIPVDKTALQAAVDAAEELKKEDYTEATWEALAAVLAEAKAVLADEETTQSDVDAAAETLAAAAELLRFVLPYVDVTEADWFYNSVYYNFVAKTMTGLDDTHFGPYGELSRAQFALILYRIEGTPEVETEKTFKDIAGDEWYGQAVLWAAEAGIVTGYLDGNFGPVDNITREQMAVMMYRYAKYLEKDVTKTADISGFADVDFVSEFAEEAFAWANGMGIITGRENGTMLAPQANTARAEAAAIIERFMK